MREASGAITALGAARTTGASAIMATSAAAWIACSCQRILLSLGEDELVLRGQPQPVVVAAMDDDDLARPHEQIAAVHATVHDPDGSARHRRPLLAAAARVGLSVGKRAHCLDVPKYKLVTLLV